mgnify:FL=1
MMETPSCGKDRLGPHPNGVSDSVPSEVLDDA